MKNLLKLEFRKLKTRKSFYICIAVMVGMFAVSTFTINGLINPDFSEDLGLSGINSLIGALSSSSFTMISGIFVALFVCEDYTSQTVKNIYAKGYSRTKVYLSKLITILISTTVMLIIIDLVAFALGTALYGVGKNSDKLLPVLATQYIIAMAEVTFAFTIASVIRKTGGAIACIIIAPMFLGVLLGLADTFIPFENFTISKLWLSNFLSVFQTLDISTNQILLYILGSLIYFTIFNIIGLYFNKNIQL